MVEQILKKHKNLFHYDSEEMYFEEAVAPLAKELSDYISSHYIAKEKKIEFWTDIALYANKCGLQGEEYMRFAEYGASLLGLKIYTEDYDRLKECGLR